jgi:hypothetical protein
MKLNHPALGTTGGAALHSAVEALYQKIGDMSTSRWFAQAGLNNTASIDFEHNFVCNQFSDLRFDLYLYNTGTGEMTLVPSPRTGWAIIATPGQEKTHIRVTNNTGSAKDIALVVEQDPIELDELTDVIITSPAANQVLKYNGTNWINSNPSGLGFVPLGAIIPIASHLTNAFPIPGAGVVVDGWQYCDGSNIVGQTVQGQVPNLTDSRFLMGFNSSGLSLGSNTHSHSVTTNVTVGDHGNHTHNVTSNVTVGDHGNHTHNVTSNVTVTSQTFTGIAASYAVTVPLHYHGIAGITLTDPGHSHNIGAASSGGNTFNPGALATGSLPRTGFYPGEITINSTGISLSGYVGAGGTSGDNNFSASGVNTPSGNISVTLNNAGVVSGSQNQTIGHSVANNGVVSGNQNQTIGHSVLNNAVSTQPGSTLPQYFTVQYIIRVS